MFTSYHTLHEKVHVGVCNTPGSVCSCMCTPAGICVCVCICECTHVHVITLCMMMYGSVYTCDYECLQVYVCMGVTLGLQHTPPRQWSWLCPQHLPEVGGSMAPWLLIADALHVPPPWGHHTGDPPPGQQALQAGLSRDAGPSEVEARGCLYHLPLVSCSFSC